LTQNTDPAALIREVRGRLGLTQEKFAARLGVTLPTINRWENGRTKPSPLAMEKLQQLISSIDDLAIPPTQKAKE
jgi:putative transcriptional regulator